MSARLNPGARLKVKYTNWRGEIRERDIAFTTAPYWGSTEWHPESQWLIEGMDCETKEARIWAVKDMEPLP